jgi:hypothetical protein
VIPYGREMFEFFGVARVDFLFVVALFELLSCKLYLN